MNSLDSIRSLFKHMEWADAKTWQGILGCEAAQSDEYVRSRMLHIHTVQRAFLSTWRGEPLPSFDHEMKAAEMLPWSIEYHAFAHQYVDRLKPAHLEDVVIIPWSSGAAKRLGHPASPTTLADTIQQVMMHTAYHRGQVAARLKELGGAPPVTDYIVWLWSGRPAAAWPALTVG